MMTDDGLTDEQVEQWAADDPYNSTRTRKQVRALAVEVQRLRKLGPWPPAIADRFSTLTAERDRLRAEVERLRARDASVSEPTGTLRP